MLYSGKQIRTSRDKINKYSNSCVGRKQVSGRNKIPYPPPPPCKLNGRSLKTGAQYEWIQTLEKLTEKHCNRNLPDLLYTVHLYILSKKINFQVVVSTTFQFFNTFYRYNWGRYRSSCNNVAPVTNLCLGRATTRSHSSQWSKKKVAVET